MDGVGYTSDSTAAAAFATTITPAVMPGGDDAVATPGTTDGFEPARANVAYLGTVTSLSQLATPDVLQDTAGWDDRNRGLGNDIEHVRATSSQGESDGHHHTEAVRQRAHRPADPQRSEPQHQRVSYALSSSPHLELRGAEPTIESGAISDLAAFTSGAVTTNDRGIEA